MGSKSVPKAFRRALATRAHRSLFVKPCAAPGLFPPVPLCCHDLIGSRHGHLSHSNLIQRDWR
eukprot:6102139-Pyramimonas_sp.AAC.1